MDRLCGGVCVCFFVVWLVSSMTKQSVFGLSVGQMWLDSRTQTSTIEILLAIKVKTQSGNMWGLWDFVAWCL